MKLRNLSLIAAWICLPLLSIPGHAAGQAALEPVPTQNAPTLSLPALGKSAVALSDYKGKVVLVNFWATYCKPCREEMPSLERLRQRYASKGFEILGVDVADERSAVQQFLVKTPVSFPILLDADGASMGQWQALGLPASFLVDRQGRLRARLIGGADWESSALTLAIEKLLAGKGL